jgi:CspA family cold shock protein
LEKEDMVEGQVKWFDTTKGFGFIVADESKKDILLNANVLRSFGRNSVAGNARIVVKTQDTDRGCQATEIISIDSPELESAKESIKSILGEDVEIDPNSELLPARVKWFDRGKGFGFVNVFGNSEDVFVHMEVLHAAGLAELQPGEAVGIRLASGPRGRMAWDVQVWDQAIGIKG